jgi:ribulose bisphosphate carboxylase small subunit
MYKVTDKFKGCFVTCSKFIVNLAEATQEQLEHLYHSGHKGIEFVGSKKPKNKIIDNLSSETDTNINE